MPIRNTKLNKSIIYFDNAASSIRPVEFVDKYTEIFGLNRTPQEEKQILFDLANKLASILNVDVSTISFVPNATYGINEIAYSLSNSGREIYLSTSEHSSNHIIWLKIFKSINYFHLYELDKIEIPKNSIFSFSLLTNLEGEEVSLCTVEKIFKNTDVICIVDASQYMQHKIPNLNNACIDYLVFTAHKFYGPNGVGVIYSKNQTALGINYLNYDSRACDYFLDFYGLEAWCSSLDVTIDLFNSGEISRAEQELNEFFVSYFPNNKYLDLVNKDTKGCIFLLRVIDENITAHDYAFYLFKEGIITRTGLSCSWLSQHKYDANRLIRVSLSYLNTKEEIKIFFKKILEFDISLCL